MASDQVKIRVRRWIPVIGIVGCCYALYVLGFNLGLTDVVLFEKVGEFELSKAGSWIYLALLLLGSCYLSSLWFMLITLSSDGVTYETLWRRRSVPADRVEVLNLSTTKPLVLLETSSKTRFHLSYTDYGRHRQVIASSVERWPSV